MIEKARLLAPLDPDAAAAVARKALGSSMLPAIKEGDLVEVRAPEGIAAGDVAVFRRGRELVAHRVKAVLPDGSLLTQGDNSAAPDAPVPAADVLGKVTRVSAPAVRLPGRALRRAVLALLGAAKAVPVLRAALKRLVPRLCRWSPATRAPLRGVEAYLPARLDEADLVVASLFGRDAAVLDLRNGSVEMRESLSGLGIEERLRAWPTKR